MISRIVDNSNLPTPIGLYAGDIMWELILSELREHCYCLTPVVRQLNGYQGTIVKQEYESILCKIDDLLELAQIVEDAPVKSYQTSIQQIAADVGESYLRRFGTDSAAKFAIFIDEKLPVVMTDPQRLMRIVDCLARRARLAGNSRRNELEIKYHLVENSNPQRVAVTILSTDVPLSCPPSRRAQILEMVNAGNYLFAVKDFGIELCCAFHLTRKFGGLITVDINDRERAVVRLDLKFDYVKAANSQTDINTKICIYTGSSETAKHFENMAELHKLDLVRVTELDQVPTDALLVYDAVNLRRENYRVFEQLSAEKTLLLLGSSEDSDLAVIQELGFHHYTRLPIISTRILQLFGQMKGPSFKDAIAQIVASHKRILNVCIVDDTETARILVREHLIAGGHRVDELSDGTELVEKIKAGNKYDLIISDVAMCHMDGITAINLVREYEAGTGTRSAIALMTSYKADDETLQGKSYDWLLHKPVSATELQSIIESVSLKKLEKHLKIQPTGITLSTEIIILDDLKKRCGGRTLIMTKMLNSFIESSQSYLPKLGQQNQDTIVLARTLHALKGLLREISAPSSAQQVETLEGKLKQGQQVSKQELSSLAEVVSTVCDSARTIQQQLRATE